MFELKICEINLGHVLNREVVDGEGGTRFSALAPCL
jgi:hypothetical protein